MKITNIIALMTAIPLVLGGITKGVDMVKYNLLGKAHNDEEVYVRHMKADHLYTDEKPAITNIQIPDGGLARFLAYSDGCIVIKRQTEDGMTTGNKIFVKPEYAEKIKEMYSDSGNIAYAGMQKFDFGVHKGDLNYKEEKKRTIVIRYYRDGCNLGYEIDDYGNTASWRWLLYKH